MQVGQYLLQAELGRGGSGVVYRAVGPDGRPVAVKVLLQGAAAAEDPQATGRFAREARLLAELEQADGFVPMLDRGEGPSGPWLVMPLLEGGTLRDRLRDGPLPVPEAVGVVRRLATTLGRAHARGVVHRDVKPENVLFAAGDLRPLLADLGLAKRRDDDALSRTGELRGTVGYMAPEQLRDAKSAGPPADVFALGVLLFECLAGVHPFEGLGALETIARIESSADRVGLLATQRPDVPRWLARVVARCLAADPAQRFPDGAALAMALVAGEQAASRGRAIPLALGLALLALAGGAAAVLATRPVASPAPAPPPPGPAGGLPGGGPPAPAVAPPGDLQDVGPPGAGGDATAAAGAADAQVRGGAAPPEEVPGEVASSDTRRFPAAPPGAGLAEDLALAGAWRVEGLYGEPGFRSADPVAEVALARRAEVVFALDAAGWLRAWRVGGGAPTIPPMDLGEGARGLAVSPDGARWAWINAKGFACTAGAGLQRLLWSDQGDARALAWTQDGARVVIARGDAKSTVLDPAGRKVVLSLGHDAAPCALAAARDGKHLAVGREDGALELWDVPARTRVKVLNGVGKPARRVGITPDGGVVVAAISGFGLARWAPARSDAKGQALEDWLDPQAVGLRRDGTVVALYPRNFAEWRAGEDKLLRGTTEDQAAAAVLFGDGERGLYAHRPPATLLSGLQIVARQSGWLSKGHGGPVTAIVERAGGELATAARDGTVRAWRGDAPPERLASASAAWPEALVEVQGALWSGWSDGRVRDGVGVERAALPGPILWLGARDGRVLAAAGVAVVALDAASPDAAPEVVAPGTGDPLGGAALVGEDGVVTWTRAEPGARGELIVWGDGAPRVRAPVGAVRALAAPPRDDLPALLGEADGKLRWVDLRRGREVALVAGHEAAVTCAAISPDGRLAVTGGRDRTLRLWSPEDRGALGVVTLTRSADVPTALRFTDDGAALLVGTAGGLIVRLALEGR